MNYFLVIISTVLSAIDMVLVKKYQTREGAELKSSLKFYMLNGLFTGFFFFALTGFKPEFSWFSVAMSFLMTVFVLSYSLIGFYVLKVGNMAMYSIFLMCGGMVLPYIFGLVFLNEPLTLLRVIGIITILIAVILSNKAKYSIKLSLFLLYIAVFVLNGFVSIVSKCHQIDTPFISVGSTDFVMYAGLWKFILSCIILPFVKEKPNNNKKAFFSAKDTILIIVCSTMFSGLAYMFQLIGATTLPATVLYPIGSGGSIIFSALAGRIFFKEKLSVYQIISIALCFIGTLLFL